MGGRYKADSKPEKDLTNSERKEREDRDLIFDAFKRGVEAFAKEYDKQHPNKPLMQVNVGMGYNRLKRNVEQLENATKTLAVPEEYGFEDAQSRQYVLYKRKQRTEDEIDR